MSKIFVNLFAVVVVSTVIVLLIPSLQGQDDDALKTAAGKTAVEKGGTDPVRDAPPREADARGGEREPIREEGRDGWEREAERREDSGERREREDERDWEFEAVIERLSGSHNCNACHVGARSAAVEQIVEASRLLAEAGMGDLAELVRQRAREVRERIERGHRDPDEEHARREERRGPEDRPDHERPRRGERRDPDRREGHPQPPELHEAVQQQPARAQAVLESLLSDFDSSIHS